MFQSRSPSSHSRYWWIHFPGWNVMAAVDRAASLAGPFSGSTRTNHWSPESQGSISVWHR